MSACLYGNKDYEFSKFMLSKEKLIKRNWEMLCTLEYLKEKCGRYISSQGRLRDIQILVKEDIYKQRGPTQGYLQAKRADSDISQEKNADSYISSSKEVQLRCFFKKRGPIK